MIAFRKIAEFITLITPERRGAALLRSYLARSLYLSVGARGITKASLEETPEMFASCGF